MMIPFIPFNSRSSIGFRSHSRCTLVVLLTITWRPLILARSSAPFDRKFGSWSVR